MRTTFALDADAFGSLQAGVGVFLLATTRLSTSEIGAAPQLSGGERPVHAHCARMISRRIKSAYW
ncbi:hypothetical protein F8O01_15865 [Pseudoclavibacter chungangensis]|uniref:Uncharacterized protein n=1 Tax=Pseudoclavibacter chungangensis TaxID=587635 RepID=A0A7J5BPS0_9MICO|nr:hypothetical protein [Pseudoclavibacter chungangensis]KAB1652959.1 hypothetical protein F8O01_15865 [Pseudoclavibacter chungangensis]NYJ65243.1 hypothetical protein [Pseudoclavibacter chungangensis]